MSFLTSSGFTGSNKRSCLIRCKAALVLINKQCAWGTTYGSYLFEEVLFISKQDRSKVLCLTKTQDLKEIENLCLSQHGCSVEFVTKCGATLPGSKVYKSNVISGYYKPVQYVAEDIFTNDIIQNMKYHGISYPKQFSTSNSHEINFVQNINFCISAGYFNSIFGYIPIAAVPILSYCKADVVIHCLKSSNTITQIYVSHKADRDPTSFRQWSGLSRDSGDTIYNHPIVRDIKRIVENSGYVVGTKQTIDISSEPEYESLAMRSMYGCDYDKNSISTSSNFVDMICFGSPATTKAGINNFFHRVQENAIFSHISFSVNSIPVNLRPVISLRPASDRGVNLHGLKLQNTRISISPAGTFGT